MKLHILSRIAATLFLVLCVVVPHAAFAASTNTPSAVFAGALEQLFAPFTSFFFGSVTSGFDYTTIRSFASEHARHCVSITAAQSRYDCYQDAAKELLAHASFLDINLALNDAQFDCHDLMHSIAARAYNQYGSLANVYQQATFACFGAAYHGGAEGYLLAHNLQGASQHDLDTTILSGCRDALSESSPLYFQCVHGIGHALMFVLADALPQALTLCDTFSNDGERVNCYGGVFMENIPSSQLSPHVSQYVRTNDIYYPCTILAAHYKASCYHFQFSRISETTGGSRANVVAYCAGVPTAYQDQCYRDAGQTIAAMYSDTVARVEACRAFGITSRIQSCMRGAVRFYLDRYAGVPEKLVGAFDFCAVTPNEYKTGCFIEVGEIMAGRIKPPTHQETQTTARTICAPAQEYQDVCVKGVFTKQVAI